MPGVRRDGGANRFVRIVTRHPRSCGRLIGMSRDPFTRWGWLIALATGLAWILPVPLARISSDPDYWDCNSSWDYALNAIDPVKFFLTAAAVWALYAVQRNCSRATVLRWAAVAAIVGAIGAGINNPIEHCADVEAMGLFLWVPANMLWILGLLVMGGLMLADRVLPFWAGLAVLIGVVGLFALKEDGGIAHGLAWMIVSLALWRSRSSIQQSERRGQDGPNRPVERFDSTARQVKRNPPD